MTANETAQVDISKSVSGTENWKNLDFFITVFFKIGVPGGLKKVTAQPPVHRSICIPGGMSISDLKVLERGGVKVASHAVPCVSCDVAQLHPLVTDTRK